MRLRAKTHKQNTHRALANTQLSCPNPERIALDTLIQISNEPAELAFDNKILKTEECEGLPLKSADFTGKSSSRPKIITKPATAGEYRSRSNFLGTNKKHFMADGKGSPPLLNRSIRRQYSKELGKDLNTQALSYQLSQPISSNTVFIRKITLKKKESFSTVVLPLRGKNKNRVSPQSSDIFSRIDNTIFFNHTINFGNRQIRDDLKEVLGSIKKGEGKRKMSRDRMNMTHRVNYSIHKHKSRLSIFNIEFPQTQTARLPSFCL